MTLQAGAWLFGGLLTFRVSLVVEHIGMTTFFAEIPGESITGPHGLKPWIFFETRLRYNRTWIGVRRRVRQRFTSAILRPHLIDRPSVAIVLQWKVLSPERRIIC